MDPLIEKILIAYVFICIIYGLQILYKKHKLKILKDKMEKKQK